LKCVPLCTTLEDGLHFIQPTVLPKHEFRGKRDACGMRRVGNQRGGLAISQPDFVACRTCNRWLCFECRLAQTLGACILRPALLRVTNIPGPALRIPSTCRQKGAVDALTRAADRACRLSDTGKYSTGRWAAGAQATSDRGRGPRVAKAWHDAADRCASPPEEESCSESPGSGSYSYKTTEDEEDYHLVL